MDEVDTVVGIIVGGEGVGISSGIQLQPFVAGVAGGTSGIGGTATQGLELVPVTVREA